MEICVTGGAGMIGSALVKKLIEKKYKVIVIDNLWRGKLENLMHGGEYIIDIKNNFHKLDIGDPNNINTIKKVISKCYAVIHLADIVAGIGYVFNNQYQIFRQNVLINMNLFHATCSVNIPNIIYLGTACSFPLELQTSLNSKLKESDLFPANPESAYGWSKLIGQLELKYMHESKNMNITTLMLHNVYGINCEYEGERTQVIPSLINRILNTKDGDTLEVWGSGNQGRAFVYVEDVIDAIVKTLETNNLPECIQIGPDYCTSITELVSELIKISEKKIRIHFDVTKPEGDKGRYADYSLAKKLLNWEPRKPLINGLHETYNWIKTQKEINQTRKA